MKKRNLITVIAVVTAITVGFMIGRGSTQKDTQRHCTNWFLIGMQFEQYAFQQEDDQKWNKILDEAFYLLEKPSFEEELDFLEKLAEFNLKMEETPSANEM